MSADYSDLIDRLTLYEHRSGYDGKDWEGIATEAANAIKDLSRPMEAVPFMYAYECVDDDQWQAYRQQLRRADGSICPGRPLYTHPPQPDALRGDLREKVAKIIAETFEGGGGAASGHDFEWDCTEAKELSAQAADAILSLIQSERGEP